VSEASSHALSHGLEVTRAALEEWRDSPWRALRSWLAGSLAIAVVLLALIVFVATVDPGKGTFAIWQPPFSPGDSGDVAQIFARNLLVLALHAMACVAGFIAGDSLALQIRSQTGLTRWIHEHGRRFAMLFVAAATLFSLSLQAYALGLAVGRVAVALHASPLTVLLGVLPHALPELMALFLPLAAWLIASRRGHWDRLLAASLVTSAIAVPVLLLTATWEVYLAPHLMSALLGYPLA
jgi:uncharacterized membrane protein SpoIIM required for sporulation